MEEISHLIEAGHVHALIQQSRYHEAARMLEDMIEEHWLDPYWLGLRLIVASMQPSVNDFMRVNAMIEKRFYGSGQDWLARGLYPGVDIWRAKACLLVARKKMTDDPYIDYFLARTWLRLGNIKKALIHANICFRLDPRFYKVLLVRMECYRRMGARALQIKDALSFSCYLGGVNKDYLWKSIGGG